MRATKYMNIAGGATTKVGSGPCRLDRIVVNKAVLSTTITLYDSPDTSGTKIGTITNPSTLKHNQIVHNYDGLQCLVGLCVVTSGADDITVVYYQ